MNKSDSHQAIAIVTGSTSGIGYAIATALLKRGYFVYINGRDEQKAKLVLGELKTQFEHVDLIVADVTSEHGVTSLMQTIQRKKTLLDVVVTNVGSGKCNSDVLVENEDYHRILNLNFFSAVNVCQSLLPFLRSPGAIVCISSIAGVSPIGAPIPYACAKAALNMFVKEWAVRLAQRKIRVNSISPGNVMFPGSVWDKKMAANPNQTKHYIANNVPLNQFVMPEEIGNLLCQMVASGSMTGQNIVVDGGQIL